VPTYQYACTACGHQLEAVQSFTDQPLTECPACDGRLRKLFSSVGIVFKGSGFYRNDSRAAAESGNGQKGKDAAPAKEPASAGASSSGDSSGESSSSSSPSGSSSGDSSSAGSSASGGAKSDTKKVATAT
jgi:putative FmdB family regulatory protein